MVVCGLNPAEDGAPSVCKVGAPVSESLNTNVSRCPSISVILKTNFPLDSAFLLKRVKCTFHNPVALLKEPCNHVIHFAVSIVLVHNWLMLVHDQCDALEESR